MFLILQDIFSSTLGKSIAFKWGTACYFFHSLDRFSTDLDFDLLEKRDDIDDIVWTILKKYGTVKKNPYTMVLSYWESDVNIKVDINRKVIHTNTYEIKNFYGLDIRVQDRWTIFANKLVAMTERNTNRDIYDIYFFIQNTFPINEKVIQERTWKNFKEFLDVVIEKLEKLPKNYKILDGIGEVLTEKQKYFVKEKLIWELLKLLYLKRDFL